MRARGVILLLLAGCSSGATEELSFGLDEAWPQPPLLPPAAGPRLVVTNSGDDTVSLVDPRSFEELARVPVGAFPVELEGPHHAAVLPDGSAFFVGISNTVDESAQGSGPHGSHGNGSADGYLLRIDARTGRETGRARVDRSPGDVRLQPGTRRIWVSHYDLLTIAEKGAVPEAYSNVVVLDADTMERVATVPACLAGHGIGFSPDGARAYVACAWSSEVAIVDTATFAVGRAPVAADAGFSNPYEPYALAVAPDGRIWVSNVRAAPVNRWCITVLEPDGSEVVRTVDTEGLPLFGDFTSDGDRYFVVTQQPDRLLAVDAGGAIVERIELDVHGCLNAHAAALSPDERELFVVCEGDHVEEPGSLHRFSVDALEETASVTLGLFPDDVAFLPEAPR